METEIKGVGDPEIDIKNDESLSNLVKNESDIKLETRKFLEQDNDESKVEALEDKDIKPLREEIPKIDFHCESCSMNEKCDYKGRLPPFAKKIKFTEDSYIMRDPFSPPPGQHSSKTNTEYFIVLGSQCFSCQKNVCKGPECSFFYGNTVCLDCASRRISEFPLEVQRKIRKQLANL